MADNTQTQPTIYSAGIVGGGRGGAEILRIFRAASVLRVKWVCDRSLDAPAMRLAKDLGLGCHTDITAALKTPVDLIFDATGVPAVRKTLDEGLDAAGLHDKCRVFDSVMSKLLFDISADPTIRTAHTREETDIEYCLFRAGGSKFGLPMMDIAQVVESSPARPVPGSSNSMLGVVEILGNTIPVWDLARRIGLRQVPTTAAQDHSGALVILRYPGGYMVGLLVDEILGATPITMTSIDRSTMRNNVIAGTVVKEQDILLLLDPDGLTPEAP